MPWTPQQARAYQAIHYLFAGSDQWDGWVERRDWRVERSWRSGYKRDGIGRLTAPLKAE